MAINLRAVLSLEDRFSDPLRRIERQVQRTQKTMDNLSRGTNNADRSHDRLSRSVGKMASGFGRLKTAILGAAGAYATFNTAQKIFDSTVGEAMKFEQSNVMINAMFDDKKLSKQYTDMVDKMAADSPIFSSRDMYANSKSFITGSKDIKQLEKMWNLAERMAAIDPQQGVEGAVFALKELFSGDAVSIVERFEMPRAIMNEIKKLPLDEQLKRLDEYFNKIGMTQKLIDEMGNTSLGLWQQVQEKVQLILRDMGGPSLEVISKFLTNILKRLEDDDMQRFAQVGAKWIENILTGLTNSIVKVYDWFAGITSSEEWKSATTLSAKVKIIIDDLMERFTNWYENGGKDDLKDMAKKLTNGLATLLEDNSKTIVDAALRVGKSVGSALAKGISDALYSHPIANILFKSGAGALVGGKVGGAPGAVIGGAAGAIKSSADALSPYLFGKWDKPKSQGGTYTPAGEYWMNLFGIGKSHAAGIDYVPYDGYRATLHKGETVLTREEARDYRKNKGYAGVMVNIENITLNGVGGDLEKAADELMEIMSYKIRAAGEAGA